MFDDLSLVYTFITGMIIITMFDIKLSLTPDGNWNGRVHYCYIHIIYIYIHIHIHSLLYPSLYSINIHYITVIHGKMMFILTPPFKKMIFHISNQCCIHIIVSYIYIYIYPWSPTHISRVSPSHQTSVSHISHPINIHYYLLYILYPSISYNYYNIYWLNIYIYEIDIYIYMYIYIYYIP